MSGLRIKNITAASLLKNSNREVVKVICNNIVKIVDELILAAHQQGFSEIEYELPINFSINGMSKEDAQILIYSELIKIYKDDKGFEDIKFSLKQNKSLMHIGWLNGMDETEKEQRKQLIKQHVW